MFGSRLKILRERENLSQAELARQMGISQTQISRWERGDVVPASDALRAVAQQFNVTADYLLGLVDSPKAQLSLNDLTPAEQRLILLLREGSMGEVLQALATFADEKEAKE